MQSLASYSFSAMVSNAKDRIQSIDGLIDEWLNHKGADSPRATDGNFTSKTGDGTGQFSRRLIESSVGSLRDVELIETAHNGAMFSTHVNIANANNNVIVFATLSATPGESRIAPVNLYPRCPWIIRAMIERFDDWKFADQEVPLSKVFHANDEKSASLLCDALQSQARRFPIIVVSNDEDETIWPDLHEKIAEHLIGLADIAVVNAESSWILTDRLGPRDSCYLGAVRLYWPSQRPDGSLPGMKWVPTRMAALGTDGSGRSKLLAILRREVMSAAALTMSQPAIFNEIRQDSEKQRLRALEAGSRDKELDSIIAENAKLMEELAAANRTIESLRWKIAAASYESREVTAANDDEATGLVDESEKHTPPKAGETRFYKKIGSGGGVDALVQTKACQHKESNWRPAFKGDQAEKGLLKLEGRNDWRSIAHCSACTGGGRWRVNW